MIDKINAPNFFGWFMIPFFIALAIGYGVGLKFAIRDYRAGGYNIQEYDRDCSHGVSLRCHREYDYNQCYNREISRCHTNTRKGAKSGPIYVYIFVPILVGLIFASMVYKIVLYIMNPELAATVIIFNMFFNGRVHRHHTIRPRRHHRVGFWWN